MDIAYSEWLQSTERTLDRVDAAAKAKWGSRGRTMLLSGHLTTAASASARGDAIMAFAKLPAVEEEIIVPQLLDITALRGKTATVTIANDPNYAAGVVVFVLGGGVDHGQGVTMLTVLRRLSNG